MKHLAKKAVLLCLLLLASTNLPAQGIDVEILGSDELTQMETRLEKTIYARSIAKGINLDDFAHLSITLSQLGSTISFDAILEADQPRAYHRDLQSMDEMTLAIDEMLDVIFLNQTPTATTPEAGPQLAPAIIREPINLPYECTSVTVLNGEIYFSSKSEIFKLVDGAPVSHMQFPGTDIIWRISAYRDSLIVLTKNKEQMRSFQIKDGREIRSWSNPVTPMGDGLITAALRMKPDMTTEENRWSKPGTVDGQPDSVTAGTDILGCASGRIMPDSQNPQLITYNSTDRLIVKDGRKTVWTNDKSMGRQPHFIRETYKVKSSPISGQRGDTKNKTTRYYLPSRILVSPEGEIIAALNGQGAYARTPNINIYKSAKIVSYKYDDSQVQEKIIAKSSLGYCADFALTGDEVVYLTTNGKQSQLRSARR